MVLSEGKGVDMWLDRRGINPQNFRNYIVSKSPETLCSVSYKPSKRSSDKFKRFVDWFLKQDLKKLEQEWKEVDKVSRQKKAEKRKIYFENLLLEYNKMDFDSIVEKHRGKSKNQFTSYLKQKGLSYKKIKEMIKIWKQKHNYG